MMTVTDHKPGAGATADARDLNDLLKSIAERAALLIASLDPSGASFQHAHEIGRAAVSARRLAIGYGALDASEPVVDQTLPDRRLAPTVLVVDDEPGIREFIRIVLLQAGYEVLIFPGPRAALDALRRQPSISLMLVDIIMPEMDGYEVAEEARKITPNIQIVLVSTFSPDPARQSGNDSFLAKPFSRDALTAVVSKALSS